MILTISLGENLRKIVQNTTKLIRIAIVLHVPIRNNLEKEVVRKDGNENERLSNFTQRYKFNLRNSDIISQLQ